MEDCKVFQINRNWENLGYNTNYGLHYGYIMDFQYVSHYLQLLQKSKRYLFHIRSLQHTWISWPKRKESVFLLCTTGGEGKDQQEALNLQHLKC